MILQSKKPEKQFITAREVAELLDINEKKVYTLAHEGKIPGTKVTGKWLFPRKGLEQYLHHKATSTLKRFSNESALSKNILLIAGSDDPLLYSIQGMLHALHPEFVLFSASVGSSEGLRLLSRSFCHIALSHLYDPECEDYTFPFLETLFENPQELAAINLFHRTVGFITREGPVHTFSDIASENLRFVNRQAGSGIRVRVDRMLADEKIEKDRIRGYENEVNTHFSVANEILGHRADVGIATESVARYAQLHFARLFEERFDMVLFKDSFFEENVQTFVEFIRSAGFIDLINNLQGYNSRETGKVIYPHEKQ
jgi:excisionase family DNA binding protein